MAYSNIKSVAVIGAGPSGAITAAALHAENYFSRIRVFERRDTAGGTWIYNPKPDHSIVPRPGALPKELDPPLPIPHLKERQSTFEPPVTQQRFGSTPIYEDLTTNVPAIAMSFSDAPFAYGPFVHHHIPRQYVENYFSIHGTDRFLSLGTTVEDVSKLDGDAGWKLTLRKYDVVKDADEWWTETFDAIVIGNGHYNVPFIPEVKGLEAFIKSFPGHIQHSKSFRTGREYEDLRVIVVGNSASGTDVTEILKTQSKTVYQSRRHKSLLIPDPEGVILKGVITEYLPSGRIVFEDGSHLDDIDKIIYATGYKASFPFWNNKANGGELWDYEQNRLPGIYLHTFLNAHPTIGFVGGLGLVLTFRSFEYQAIALARIFAGRSRTFESISLAEKEKWESDRLALVWEQGRKFHDVHPLFEFPAFVEGRGEAWEWLTKLSELAGLPTLGGKGRTPPVLGEKFLWALQHQRKWPGPRKTVPSVPVSDEVVHEVFNSQQQDLGQLSELVEEAERFALDSSGSNTPDTIPGEHLAPLTPTKWVVIENQVADL